MEQYQLQIMVAGCAGTGKSAVAQLIADTLKANGFNVDLVEEEHAPRTPEMLAQIVQTMSARDTKLAIKMTEMKITVGSVQLARDSAPSWRVVS